ncbi:hypothetical protein HDU76_006466, partial [Blyttiomyces sp. JEL0837]
ELEQYTNPSTNTAINNNSAGLGFSSASFEWKNTDEDADKKKKNAGKSAAKKSWFNFKKNKATPVPTTEPTTEPESQNVFRITNLDITFPMNQLSVIIGATGSGKSSLLLALLGEMNRINGTRSCPSQESIGVAYVSQFAWLTNATIRDNILFGSEFDAERYRNVVKGCALEKDFETLDGGDQTEIGEKGINLSGGQKQRIALARAAYSSSPFVVLDDPLSAVDAPTARHLYEQCILGLLANRTRILVTNAVGLAIPRADYLVMLDSGKVVSKGSVESVISELRRGFITGAFADSVLEMADVVVAERKRYLDKHGKLVYSGSLEAIDNFGRVGGVFGLDGKAVATTADNGITEEERARKEKAKLVEDEKMEKGNVNFKVYMLYFSSMGGIPYLTLLFFGYSFNHGTAIAQDLIIERWTRAYETVKGLLLMVSPKIEMLISSFASGSVEPTTSSTFTASVQSFGAFKLPDNDNTTSPSPPPIDTVGITNFYLTIYGIVGILCMISILARLMLLLWGQVMAARSIHRKMMMRLLRAPLRFFEVTPIGRITNRFTKDISSVDWEVGGATGNLVFHIIAATFVIGTVSYFIPVLLIAMIPITYVYARIGLYYIRTSRSLKRIDSVVKSPMFSQFSETLNGVTTIRAFQHTRRFEKEFSRRVDDFNRANYYLAISNLWLSVRIQAIGTLIMFFSGVFVIAAGIGPGLAGLCLNFTLTLTDTLISLVRMQSWLEMSMNSIERVYEYLNIDQEAPEVIEGNRPGDNWPSQGHVSIRNLEMRYSATTPVVLHGVSAEIGAREKVGIVGRTGAGKSTLTLAMFRILEPSSGTIVIDGVDIRQIGLDDLRSHLTIIPQDPVLFAGTVRTNLDPFGQVSDAELWAALKRAHLATPSTASESVQVTETITTTTVTRASSSSTLVEEDVVISVSDDAASTSTKKGNEFVITLDTPISEGGSNLSAGQRQLLCLARALAKKSHVIMLDEATASVDTETDGRIQQTIRSEFADCTVLTIAHRLKTIVDCEYQLYLFEVVAALVGVETKTNVSPQTDDRVIVLDQGRIIENGSPLELIEKSPVKAFRKMCEETGEFEELVAIAKRK